MKKLTATYSLILLTYLSFGQMAISYDDAKKQGLYPAFDSIYKSAAHVDSNKAVFKGKKQHEVVMAYYAMIKDLADYLDKNGFKWGSISHYWNRVYFNADGKVDYYMYKFAPDALDQQKENQFKEMVNKFLKDYQFPFTAKEKFAQCSSVVVSKPKVDSTCVNP